MFLFRLVNSFCHTYHQKDCMSLPFNTSSVTLQQKPGFGVGSFGRSRIPDNTGCRSRIFFSDSGCPIGSFFTSHSIGNSCWNGTISFETFVGTDISCCAPRFPLILQPNSFPLCWGVGVGNFGKSGAGSRKGRSWSRIFHSDSATLTKLKFFGYFSVIRMCTVEIDSKHFQTQLRLCQNNFKHSKVG